jgi:hypothetical protein
MTFSDEVFEKVLSKVRLTTTLVEEDPTVVVETTQGDERVSPTAHVVPELAKSKLSNVSVANIFRSPDTHPLVLDLALLRKYKTEWLGWELETIVSRVTTDFGTPTVSDVNMEKVQACKALHLVDDFWLKWEVFLPCCAAFNGMFADFRNMQQPDVAECMVAVDIANRIRDDMQWSGEVKAFLAVVHRHQSCMCPLPPLDFVTLDTEAYPVDCASIMARWPLVRATGKPPTGDTIEDEQLRRMLGSWAYLEVFRTRLTSQLQVLQYV